jgi:hypothetical protein
MSNREKIHFCLWRVDENKILSKCERIRHSYNNTFCVQTLFTTVSFDIFRQSIRRWMHVEWINWQWMAWGKSGGEKGIRREPRAWSLDLIVASRRNSIRVCAQRYVCAAGNASKLRTIAITGSGGWAHLCSPDKLSDTDPTAKFLWCSAGARLPRARACTRARISADSAFAGVDTPQPVRVHSTEIRKARLRQAGMGEFQEKYILSMTDWRIGGDSFRIVLALSG